MNIELPEIVSRSRRVIDILTREFPSRNGLNPLSLKGAADFIEREFKPLDVTAASQSFQCGRITVRNLIVEKQGKYPTKPCIVVGAHYDTVMDTPGADDNASGIAGLIELIRLFQMVSNERTIRFAAFCNEEPPYFDSPLMGSWQYARSLKEQRIPILTMISLEMIGFAGHDVKQRYPFPLMGKIGGYPESGNFIGLVGNLRTRSIVNRAREAMRKSCSIGVESLCAPGFIPPLFLSDHSSFWRHNYPAFMVTDTSFLRNPHYHLPTDVVESLNFDFLAETVRGLFEAIRILDIR